MELEQITTGLIFSFFIIMCRIGSAIMLFPGIGETYVSVNIRLIVALAVSFLLLPILMPILPKAPASPAALLIVVFGEVMTGIFIGMILRMMLSLIHVSGMIIAIQSSLASALLFDATQASQGSVVGIFMTMLAVTLLFSSGLHHLMFLGISSSYQLFPPGLFPNTGEFMEMAGRLVSHGFLVGIKIAAPVLVVTTIMYMVAGVMARLMPTMQVFFVITPLQVLVTFAVMMMTLSVGMMWYLEYYRDAISFLDSGK